MNTEEKFDIEFQYNLYLDKVGLSEENMHPVQAQETKRAFMAAAGQILVLLRDDISELSDDEGVEVLEKLMTQVANFWTNEIVNPN